MDKIFELFMSQLQETNQALDFFCDFKKIKKNVDDIKLSLYMLNSLINSRDLRNSVEILWKRDKTAPISDGRASGRTQSAAHPRFSSSHPHRCVGYAAPRPCS